MTRLSFQSRHRYPSGFLMDACFSAGDGVTALFGPSGSGKSTVLAVIAGILRPDNGYVRLADRLLLDTAAGVRLPPERRRIGLVFQDHLLFPHLSVGANLRYGMGRDRAPGRAIDFESVVRVLELDDLLDRYPHTLSGGQRQRTALGRAILRDPELLLMDEPLTALDAGLKDRILAYLERAVAEWRIPTLYVTHDQTDLRRLADAVVVLSAGKVVDAGPPTKMLDKLVLSGAAGPRDGPINLLRIEHARRHKGRTEGRLGQHSFQLPASPVAQSERVYVRFAATDVTLARSEVSGISTRNHLPGVVREVVALADRILVAVDVGQPLWAEITPEAVGQLQLASGSEVVCLIKTTAMQVID